MLRNMRRTPLLFLFAAVAVVLLPVPVLAAPCSETAPVVRFDANPKTDVAVGSETRFTFKFHFSVPCEGGVTLQGETHQIYNSVDTVVRRTPLWDLVPHPEFRDATDDNWDFNATVATNPGQYQFRGRVLLDDRQITESAPVTVTVAGAAPTGGPATSGGEGGPVQAGPVPLEVTIGSYASAADIPSYVAALYRYGLGIGVTLAMVMVVVGGFQYMTARGNPSAIGAARGRITNAILGLLLLLGSFTLLQTINPELVTMRNIIVPPIQRVETIDNKCEDLPRPPFSVSPTSGRCGEEGTVSRSDGVGVANNTCTWGTCSGAEPGVCVVRGSEGPGCVVCGQVIDDQLEHWGLTQSDEGCARFAPPNTTDHHKFCIFSEDNTLDLNHDVCALVDVNCTAITDCSGYNSLQATSQGTSIDLTNMTHDVGVGIFGRDPTDFPRICNSNPCDVSGGCRAVESGVVAWTCEPSTGSASPPAAPAPTTEPDGDPGIGGRGRY